MDDPDTGHAEEATLRIDASSGAMAAKEGQSTNSGHMIPGSLFLGKYDIQDRIGSGGMGVVYRCSQIFIGKDMAIKTLNQSSMNDEAVQRFQTEAKAAGSLSHPNLVSVCDFGVTEDGTPYMVMDYVPGKTLQDVLSAHGQLALETVIDIFIQCADGLTHAHEKGVLHRDIKPSNIVLLQQENLGPGSIRILDFGIAKISSNSAQTQELTKTGMVIGSPLYMSPEQSVGKKMDARTDIYSLGCVLFECLCGTPPFQGDSVIETLMLHQTEMPRSLKEASMGREFPSRLQELVSSMMAKNLEERINSMSTVHHELVEIKEQLKSPGIAKKSPLNPGVPTEVKKNKWLSTPAIVSAVVLGAVAIATVMVSQLTVTEKPVKKTTLMDGTFVSSGEEQASYDERVRRRILDSKNRGMDRVNMKAMEFSQSQFELIAKEKWIRDLTLIECQRFTPHGLDTILANKIEVLNLHGSELDDQCLASIARCNILRDLDISKCSGISQAGLLKIARMKNLHAVNLQGVPLSDEVLKVIVENMPYLSNLNISDNPLVSDNSMRIVGRHKYPKGLNISSTSVSDEGLKYLGKNVGYLEIVGDRRITDAGIETLVKCCPLLRAVQMPGTSATPKGIMQLAKLKLLVSLELGAVPHADEAARKRIRDAFKARKVDLFGF